MAKVQLTNVAVLDNPTAFLNPFQFEITFECFEDLPNGQHARISDLYLRVLCVTSLLVRFGVENHLRGVSIKRGTRPDT